MYRTIDDFERDWTYERGVTEKIFRALNDASLNQRVTPDGRSLGFLAWHLVICLGMAHEAGLPSFEPMNPETSQPATGVAIADAYARSASELATAVQRQWQDANLLEEVPMYGETWTRGYALFAMVKHQAHHRGQMTVLMRQAGLPVPGAYGPSKEEWAAMGMDAQP